MAKVSSTGDWFMKPSKPDKFDYIITQKLNVSRVERTSIVFIYIYIYIGMISPCQYLDRVSRNMLWPQQRKGQLSCDVEYKYHTQELCTPVSLADFRPNHYLDQCILKYSGHGTRKGQLLSRVIKNTRTIQMNQCGQSTPLYQLV